MENSIRNTQVMHYEVWQRDTDLMYRLPKPLRDFLMFEASTSYHVKQIYDMWMGAGGDYTSGELLCMLRDQERKAQMDYLTAGERRGTIGDRHGVR